MWVRMHPYSAQVVLRLLTFEEPVPEPERKKVGFHVELSTERIAYTSRVMMAKCVQEGEESVKTEPILPRKKLKCKECGAEFFGNPRYLRAIGEEGSVPGSMA